MGKFEKLLDKWKKRVPPRASKSDVLGLASHYGLSHRFPTGGSSHALIEDVRLERFAGETHRTPFLDNIMVIPIVKGQEVKKPYIRRLVEFIVFLEKEDEAE